MNPREELEGARGALIRATRLVQAPGGPGDVYVLNCALEEARDSLDRAAEGAKAWEMTRGPDLPPWAIQARRISDAVDNGVWALNGVHPHQLRGRSEEVAARVDGALRALSDSLNLCLLRLDAVLVEVRHG